MLQDSSQVIGLDVVTHVLGWIHIGLAWDAESLAPQRRLILVSSILNHSIATNL